MNHLVKLKRDIQEALEKANLKVREITCTGIYIHIEVSTYRPALSEVLLNDFANIELNSIQPIVGATTLDVCYKIKKS